MDWIPVVFTLYAVNGDVLRLAQLVKTLLSCLIVAGIDQGKLTLFFLSHKAERRKQTFW